MIMRAIRLVLSAAAASLMAVAAQAGANPTTTFDWNPQAVGLDGAKFTADTMRLSDFGQIVVNPMTGGFTEAGYLPVLGFSNGGQPINPGGFNAALGNGWGAYVQYQATGTQEITVNGIVAAYSSLSYSIYGFNGLAMYGLDATGAPFESGGTDLTLLGDGSLITGSVTLVPTVFLGSIPVEFAANGQLRSTIGNVPPPSSLYMFLGFNVHIVHPPGELFPISATTFEAKGGSSSTGTLVANGVASGLTDTVALLVPVPEPGSGWLLAAGAIPIALLRRRRGRS